MFRLVIFSCLFLATFVNSARRPTQQRIVGGRRTDITEAPYQVSVRFQNGHWCGGSIIGPQHILTAAHCIEENNPSYFAIRAGSTYYFKEGDKIDVSKIIIHPNYDEDNVNYDAAVLVLKEPLKISDRVQVAKLATAEPKEGDMITISGWGAMKRGYLLLDILHSVSVPVVSQQVCKDKYKGDMEITDQMFCAGYPNGGKDSCEGDSGGPGMINGMLAGIVSWGNGCGDKNSPGVYTNIPKIRDWISAQVQ